MMTTLEKHIDYVDVGVKALKARWRVVRRLMIRVADAYPDGSETRAKYLRDAKIMGKWVRGVSWANRDPRFDALQASLARADATLVDGFRALEILEREAQMALFRAGDLDFASDRDPVTKGSAPYSADAQAEEDREIIERIYPPQCRFCERVAADLVSWDTEFCVGFHDDGPAGPGHVLVTFRRHQSDIFAQPAAAQQEMWAIAREAHAGITEERAPDGWEVVVNSGRVVGQTVEHAHMRLIPCYDGDVTEARGETA